MKPDHLLVHCSFVHLSNPIFFLKSQSDLYYINSIFFVSIRAEQLAIAKQQSEEEKENSPSKSRSLLFKRKAARRSKSLGKDHWEDVIFCK